MENIVLYGKMNRANIGRWLGAFIDSFTQLENSAFASSTSLEKEVLVNRAFVVSHILPVPGRYESYYLGILRSSAVPRSVCV